MKETLKGLAFVGAGLGVLLVGLPLLVLVAACFSLLCQLLIPFVFGLALLRALWLVPGAIRYRARNGEWHFQTVAKANGYRTGMVAAMQAERDRKQFQAYRLERIKDLTRD